MNITELLETAKKPAKKSTKKPVELPGQILEFMGKLHAKKIRVSYALWTGMLVDAGVLSEKCRNVYTAGNRYIEVLPIGQQYQVAKKSGGYHKSALAKWADEAPEGFEEFRMLDLENLESVRKALK